MESEVSGLLFTVAPLATPRADRSSPIVVLGIEETRLLRKAEADETARLAAEKAAQRRKKPKLFEQAPKVDTIGQGSEARKVLLGTTGKQSVQQSP